MNIQKLIIAALTATVLPTSLNAQHTEDSYYEFEPEDVNKENLSIAEMSGKKLDWFRKVCAAVL